MDTLDYETALAAFDGSVADMAQALGIKPQAIYLWKGRIPPLRQFQLEKIIAGRLEGEDCAA